MISTPATTALLLAAGIGSRLRPFTLDAPKCLTVVGGEPILGRLVRNLRSAGFKRLVVVTGHLENRVREYLSIHAADFRVDYVLNPLYQTTNNIYSLWLARRAIREPFVLVESDLVFDVSTLKRMRRPDKIAISRMLPWMNGTTVELNAHSGVDAFHMGGSPPQPRHFKTVNMYSLSNTSCAKSFAKLDEYIAAGRTGEYYEAVFADLIASREIAFDAVLIDEHSWCEVDTLSDLRRAEALYEPVPAQLAPAHLGQRRSDAETLVAVASSPRALFGRTPNRDLGATARRG